MLRLETLESRCLLNNQYEQLFGVPVPNLPTMCADTPPVMKTSLMPIVMIPGTGQCVPVGTNP